MKSLPEPLAPLGEYRQFVAYRLVPSVRKVGKFDKVPINPATGHGASTTNPAHWSSFDEAVAAVAAGKGNGVGFVFTAADPFWFVDIDGAYDGAWSPLADRLCRRLDGAAVEVSQSGTGLHTIGSGAVPEHGCRNIPLGLELYTKQRFVALTGTHALGSVAADLTPAIAAVAIEYFPPGPKRADNTPDDWTREPVEDWEGLSDDAELIRMAMASGGGSAAAAFGGQGITFRDLWTADAEALGKRFPSDTGGAYDGSSADFALAARLAFWTGKNCQRIRDLMYQSKLRREKWEDRDDYLTRTIQRACGVSTEVYNKQHVENECSPGSLSPPGGPPTEESLAREFVAIHGGGWRFDHSVGKWFHWDGARWLQDDRRLANHVMSDHLREAGKCCFKPQIANLRMARGMETFASSNKGIAVTAEHWDADPWLLGTPAGTVDLRTGKLHPANSKDFVTKIISIAPGEGQPTLWLRFLDEAFSQDEELIRFVQRWCGYCLTGNTTEHALAFLHGPGGNGKSVFLNTVAGILGEYSVTATTEIFAESNTDRHSTDVAMLKGARLVTASETEQGRGWAEARIKAMTGGDPVTARFMRQDNFTYRPRFKLMIAGNHAPSLRNVDAAMRRRLIVLPFLNTPSNPDRKLERKLHDEWPQVLAWMIAGCLDWQANGLQRPKAIEGATDRYFSDQDVLGTWLEEDCERGPALAAQPMSLFNSWCRYASEAGEPTGSNRDFKANLERRGIMSAKSNGARLYRGVRLREPRRGAGGTSRDGDSS